MTHDPLSQWTSVARAALATDLGIDIEPTTRDEFDQFIRAEIVRWAQVIKQAGISLQ